MWYNIHYLVGVYAQEIKGEDDVTYNLCFELAAVVVIFVVLLHFLMYRQLPRVGTKVFLAYMLAGAASSVANIVSSIGCDNPENTSAWVTQAATLAVYILTPFCELLFLWYTIRKCEKDEAWRRKALLIGSMPIVCVMVLVLANPLTGFVYSFSDGGVYTVGAGSILCYLVWIGYILSEFVLLTLFKRHIRRNNRIVIGLYTVIMLCGVGIQLYDRAFLVGGFARALVVMLVYVSMQNPGRLLDDVSNVYNELAFRNVVNEKLVNGQSFAVLHLHLNKFNGVSADIGCRNTDLLLRSVGHFLLDVGGESNTYRTETHVFAMVLKADKKSVEEKAKQIRNRFFEKWKAGDKEVLLYANTVVTYSGEHFESVSQMDAFRDYLFKYAKQKGTNALVYADESLKQKHLRENSVEHAVYRAIEQNSIEVYYQAIQSVSEERLVGAEALARLHDKELGWIPPLEFIPIAERNGAIVELGKQIFEKVCIFIAEKLMPNPHWGIDSIRVNLSTVQCMQYDMADCFMEIMDRYEVPGKLINLEVTERIALETTELMKCHMEKLGARGVKFSLDDYGTGNSNCEYLIDYSFNMVKFDKRMMDAYFSSDAANVILRNEFRTLKELGMEIVAEGIEKEEQVAKLKEESMDFIQGYVYAKPAPADEFVSLIKKQNLNEGN